MIRYVIQRILWLIVILLSVGVIIFTIMYIVPGNPATLVLGTSASPEEIQAFNEANGLDDPFFTQLGRFMKDVFLHLDFGTSYIYQTPVIQEFVSRLPRTFTLAFICMIVDVIIGIPVGIYCALKRNSFSDHAIMSTALVGMSAPNFWVALMLVVLFSKTLGWLPARGIDSVKCWIMPVIAGSLAGAGQIARQTRSAVLEAIRADFITTARAKGVSKKHVIWRHMLPNALIPVITVVGGMFAGAIAGTVVIETVFSFPGIGTYMMDGISQRDYPVVRGCVLILATFAAVVMLLVDILYAYVDPRIKAQYASKGIRKPALGRKRSAEHPETGAGVFGKAGQNSRRERGGKS